MIRLFAITLIIGCLSVMSGCSLLSPYESDFACPHVENGKCVSVQAAYDEDLDKNTKKKKDMSLQDEVNDLKNKRSEARESISNQANNNYLDAKFNKIAGLLNEPLTPMIAPPQAMRVLLFPYSGDDKRLYMPRFVFMLIEDPEWIIDPQEAVAKELN